MYILLQDPWTLLGISIVIGSALLWLVIVFVTSDMREDSLPEVYGFRLGSLHPSYPAPMGQLTPKCPCFLDNNYFINTIGERKIQMHLDFTGDSEVFCKQYARDIRKWSSQELDDALAQLRKERSFRMNADHRLEEHRSRIQREYTFITNCRLLQLHHLRPEVHTIMNTIEETWTTDGRLPPYVSADFLVGIGRLIQVTDGVFAFPFFTNEYCTKLETELINFRAVASSDLQENVNSMNRYGVSLHELGFSPTFSDVIMTNIANPLTEALFGAEYSTLDNHKCFTVEYGEDDDKDLSLHYDNSLITVNVCISADFEGGELQFFGHKRKPPLKSPITYPHRRGWAVIHLGAAWHRALPTRSGHRTNIIMWFRSQRHARDFGCDMCGKPVRSNNINAAETRPTELS